MLVYIWVQVSIAEKHPVWEHRENTFLGFMFFEKLLGFMFEKL
jgi:hypothetical protein